MKTIQVPVRDKMNNAVAAAVAAVKAQWAARSEFLKMRQSYIGGLADALKLDGEDSRLRWLAYKPPE